MKKQILMLGIASSLLLLVGSAEGGTLFRLPLATNPGYSAWFDHNATIGAELRYECSTSFPYDEHHGTDFAASMGTPIYAAATGSLYYRVDGCPDGSSPSCGGSYGNHVRIQHPSDSRVSIYAHMKNGTPIGLASVLCSATIGQTGNSGTSSGPHLHFELWQNSSIGTRLDFYGGSCSSPSYWVNQNGGWPTTQCQ
ncbi:MAG: M23 family metallopeptidase [Minisyncoccota bacterium]